MSIESDLEQVRTEIETALELVPHDRWVLSGLRDTGLVVIADSSRPWLRPGSTRRDPAPLARRCLYERQPLAVSSVLDGDPARRRHDWELDWPAILYAPIAARGRRPIGLLSLGSRRPHWYVQDEVRFVSDLAEMLVPIVAAMAEAGQPFGETERRLAYLVR